MFYRLLFINIRNMYSTLLFVIALASIISSISTLKFCAWYQKPSQTDPSKTQHVQPPKPIQNQPQYLPSQSKSSKRSQKFRSYHPHYLHSYSYPQQITPHIYFGQKNRMNEYVFLVKQNQTLQRSQASNQIFYINGKQEYGVRNVINRQNHLRFQERNLSFAMVVQVQDRRAGVARGEGRGAVTVIHFGKFLGVICQLDKGYYRSFIVYVSNLGKQSVPIQQNQEFSVDFKNLSQFNQQQSWRNAHYPSQIQNSQSINLPKDFQSQALFNTFVMIISYKSVQSADRYKIVVKEFPRVDQDEDNQQNQNVQLENLSQYNSIQVILKKMKKVDVSSFQYRFQVKHRDKSDVDSCETKAEMQLLNGLSYEVGTLVLKNGSQHIINYPKQLYSFTPSRKRFPWGFLWDDGFHCQIAVRKQPGLALKVIKSWLDTMDDSGWIPREQNRGQQRQYLCSCPLFMAKDVRDGNPPTLLLALSFLSRLNVLNQQIFEIKYWQKLKLWYKWFTETQTEQKGSFIYRWFDSIQNQGSFNSGLDDFPRLRTTTGHVDCQAWMYFFATTMADIRQKLQQIQGSYKSDASQIKQKLLQNFINPDSKIPMDYHKRSQKQYNQHFGYPSILPIAFGMLQENSEAYTATIKKIKQELDSNYGLTSISMLDPYYLGNNAYWRGPVWININYLFLRGLKLYYPRQVQLYKKVRDDVIRTVCGQEIQTGYFYQNYINGRGSFSYPFTGWTSLISIIVRENF